MENLNKNSDYLQAEKQEKSIFELEGLVQSPN
jgi:hypothetical protein